MGELLDHSLSFWDNLSVESKIIITNLLHFYNKSCLTKSSYDLYQSLYSVNDLIFKYFFNSEKGLLNLSTNESSKAYYKIKHDLRMKYLLSALNIDIDPSLLKNIVTVRNNISHELNWDDFILDFTFNEKTKENEKNTLLLQELIGLMIVKTICPHKRNQNKKLIDSRLYKVNLY